MTLDSISHCILEKHMDGGQHSLSQRIVQEYNLFLIPRTKKRRGGNSQWHFQDEQRQNTL